MAWFFVTIDFDMKKLMKNIFGFTVIEFLVGIAAISIIAVVALTNIRTLRAENRDTASKADINTLVFQLESFYEKNGYYPQAINSQTLTNLDSETFKDSHGETINQGSTLYVYSPGNCTENKCKNYEIRAELEREAPYVKESLNS